MQLLVILIAVAATILTYAASYHVLKTHTELEPARPIAAAVALLSGLSLLILGDSVVVLILIPYAALGISLLLLPLLKWFRHGKQAQDPKGWLHTPSPRLGSGQGRQQPTQRRKPTSAHLSKAQPPKE